MKLTTIALSGCFLALTACGGSDDSSGAPAADLGPEVTTYAGFTRSNGVASLLRGDRSFDSDFSVIAGGEGGTALDYFGNAYQADQRGGEGAILVHWDVARRGFDEGTGTFVSGYDRSITGFFSTLQEPRDVALAQRAGLIIVSDTGDGLVKVWGMSAGDDVAPLFTSMPPAAPWGLDYDEQNDRLYAALADGTIAVFDAFAATQPAGPTRSIVPTADGATQLSSALTGIALDPSVDRILVADPGEADGGNDGFLYFVARPSIAMGLTLADTISYGEGSLAEPVDIAMTADDRVRVADVEGDALVLFKAVEPAGSATALPNDAAPLFSRFVESPTSVAVEPAGPVRTVGEVSDIDDPMLAIAGIAVVSQEMGMPATLSLFDEELTDPPLRRFALPRGGSAVAFNALGDAYLPTGSNSSVDVIQRFATNRGTDAMDEFSASLDRQIIVGAPFAPIAFNEPLGIDLDSETDLMIVADAGQPGVFLASAAAGIGARELHVLVDGFDGATARPQGLDYDRLADRLFVAVSNGTIYVYDDYLRSPGDFPDRIITPSDAFGATQASTDLTDVVYDAQRDLLIVSDVGPDSGMGSDGALYVFDGAATAAGLVAPLVTLDGALPGLDDPTGLAWNGASAWVADPTSGVVVRFDDLVMAVDPVAPSATALIEGARAVTLVRAGLNPATGGSIATSIHGPTEPE